MGNRLCCDGTWTVLRVTDFLLSRSDSTVRADGVRTQFPDVSTATKALRDGLADIIVGALPFDLRTPAALISPLSVQFSAGSFQLRPLPSLPETVIVGERPRRQTHLDRVTRLVESIKEGALRKVVAARSIELAASKPIDPITVLGHLLARNRNANGFVVDLTPAGRTNAVLVGASPELLIAKRASTVRLHPLAGTAPRLPDPKADHVAAEKLRGSAKNHEEHAYVVDWIRDRLGPLCRTLTIPAQPRLISTPEVWHLATPIEATLRDSNVTVLELVEVLHPTPAVCGLPMPTALENIVRVEGDRGFYAGAVGWCDRHGDGDWVVAIRCLELQSGLRSARAFAGGGIVADSDPELEFDETCAKLSTVLNAFGIDQAEILSAAISLPAVTI